MTSNNSDNLTDIIQISDSPTAASIQNQAIVAEKLLNVESFESLPANAQVLNQQTHEVLRRITSADMFTADVVYEDPLLALLQKKFPYASTLAGPGKVKEKLAAMSLSPQAPSEVSYYIEKCLWFKLAAYAKNAIVALSSNGASNFLVVLEMWYYRILSLMKMRALAQAKEELDKLGDLKQDFYFINPERLYAAPFELAILQALLPSMISKDSTLESIENLYLLIHFCRREFKRCKDNAWLSRERHCFVYIANCLVDLKEYVRAAAILHDLHLVEPQNHRLLSALARVELLLGNIAQSKAYFNQVEKLLNDLQTNSDPLVSSDIERYAHDVLMMNRALVSVAANDWNAASTILTTLLAVNPENMVAINNLSICMVYTGKLQEAISMLESLIINKDPEVAGVSEPLLFNLTTLYELASEKSNERKLKILENLKLHGGEAFPIECLKL